MKKITVLLWLWCACSAVYAAVDWPNRVEVTVAANVTYDRDTGLFTYAYTLTSTAQSVQEVAGFYVPLRGGANVINLKAPPGWTSGVHRDGSMVNWCACAEEGIVVPPNYVDDGNVLPSVYQIKPSQTLTGFSFQSPDPPATGTFYAEGFVRLNVEGVDFPPGPDPYQPDFPNNLFKSEAQTPLRSESVYAGGRRPAVDGFLVFLTLKDGDTRNAPVLVDIAFGPNGETVYQSTFRATLNDIDITSQFVTMAADRRRVYLELGPSSPLKAGRNVLVTTVDGMVPGATRIATDSDRVVFIAQ